MNNGAERIHADLDKALNLLLPIVRSMVLLKLEDGGMNDHGEPFKAALERAVDAILDAKTTLIKATGP